MKKLMISMLSVIFLLSSASIGAASDWDKAGKILTVIEGLRFVSGGEIDVIGGLTDAVHGNHGKYHHKYKRHNKRKYHKQKICTKEKYWVPEYEWKKEWIPESIQHHDKYGKIHVEGHYIKYKVECGGHWEYQKVCRLR